MYNNFELYNPFISVELIVWSMFAGIVLASLLAVYNKRVIGGFVKALLSAECLSEETAKTLSELGYGTDWFIKNAVRTDTVLRRLIVRVDAVSPDEDGTQNGESAEKIKKHAGKRETVDFLTARFYIPDELKYRAEVRYARHGTDLITFGLCVVIFAAAAFAAIFIIPELLQLIDNFLTYTGSL